MAVTGKRYTDAWAAGWIILAMTARVLGQFGILPNAIFYFAPNGVMPKKESKQKSD